MSPLTPGGPESPRAASPGETGPPPASAAMSTLNLLMDMQMPMLIRFGRTRMLLRDVLGLSPGSVIEFQRLPDDPVEVVVNGRVVARGVMVAVQGNYGVSITEVTSARESAARAAAVIPDETRGNS